MLVPLAAGYGLCSFFANAKSESAIKARNLGTFSGRYRGVAIVSAETPSEGARASNQRRLVSQRAKITLKYG